jgi:hypothetical protein
MYNNPSGDANQITLGPGKIYLGATGATPATEVGYVKGNAVINLERTQTEVRQGSPQTLIKGLANREDAMIEFTGIQWNLDNIMHMLGDGATSVTDPSDFLKFGGTPTVNERALRFEHRAADGSTIFVDFWKCIPDGVMAININAEDTHEIPYKFKAIDPGATDWAGAALTDGQKLVRITRVRT